MRKFFVDSDADAIKPPHSFCGGKHAGEICLRRHQGPVDVSAPHPHLPTEEQSMLDLSQLFLLKFSMYVGLFESFEWTGYLSF